MRSFATGARGGDPRLAIGTMIESLQGGRVDSSVVYNVSYQMLEFFVLMQFVHCTYPILDKYTVRLIYTARLVETLIKISFERIAQRRINAGRTIYL